MEQRSIRIRRRVSQSHKQVTLPEGGVVLGEMVEEEPVQLYVLEKVLSSALSHIDRYRDQEVGGYFFGRVSEKESKGGRERAVVCVEDHFPIVSSESSLSHFKFCVGDSMRASAFQDTNLPDTEIVGWYHSHPGHGVFLSGPDKEIHRRYFKPFHRIAMVADPVNQSVGFFVKENGEVRSLLGVRICEAAQPTEYAQNPTESVRVSDDLETEELSSRPASEPEPIIKFSIKAVPTPADLEVEVESSFGEKPTSGKTPWWRAAKDWLGGVTTTAKLALLSRSRLSQTHPHRLGPILEWTEAAATLIRSSEELLSKAKEGLGRERSRLAMDLRRVQRELRALSVTLLSIRQALYTLDQRLDLARPQYTRFQDTPSISGVARDQQASIQEDVPPPWLRRLDKRLHSLEQRLSIVAGDMQVVLGRVEGVLDTLQRKE